jgi:hypothetical protein
MTSGSISVTRNTRPFLKGLGLAMPLTDDEKQGLHVSGGWANHREFAFVVPLGGRWDFAPDIQAEINSKFDSMPGSPKALVAMRRSFARWHGGLAGGWRSKAFSILCVQTLSPDSTGLDKARDYLEIKARR